MKSGEIINIKHEHLDSITEWLIGGSDMRKVQFSSIDWPYKHRSCNFYACNTLMFKWYCIIKFIYMYIVFCFF